MKDKQRALNNFSSALGELIQAAMDDLGPDELEIMNRSLNGGAYLEITSRVGLGQTTLECSLNGLHGERATVFSVNHDAVH